MFYLCTHTPTHTLTNTHTPCVHRDNCDSGSTLQASFSFPFFLIYNILLQRFSALKIQFISSVLYYQKINANVDFLDIAKFPFKRVAQLILFNSFCAPIYIPTKSAQVFLFSHVLNTCYLLSFC